MYVGQKMSKAKSHWGISQSLPKSNNAYAYASLVGIVHGVFTLTDYAAPA